MNVIIVNPNSSGGKGFEKWKKVRSVFENDKNLLIISNGEEVSIGKLFHDGYTNFIAAGGDGTVNYLLNRIVNSFQPEEIKKIKLGAVGIGSSNDFHKPYNNCRIAEKIPLKINFDKTGFRDVGCISFAENGILKKRYFLINASIGITAEANYFFNKPDSLLNILKKRSTCLAIYYSALKTIKSYQNIRFKIIAGEFNKEVEITNLGIVKSPHFSGGLKFNSTADYRNGFFDIHLYSGMSKFEIMKLLYLLNRQSFDKVKKKISFKTNYLSIYSYNQFLVEYDGEIIKTDSVNFSILPEYLRVCTC